MSVGRQRFYFPRLLRWGNAALVSTAALLIALHHWFPDIMTWLPVDFRVAIALVVFGFLADRILAVQQHLNPTVTVHATREVAYEHLLGLVRSYGASKIDLLQFSGATTVAFLQSVAAIGKDVEVRLFVVDDDHARRFDNDKEAGDYHLQRIKSTLNALRLIADDHPNFRINAFRYSGNAEVSAIVIDDFYASLGWNRSFLDEKTKTLRMKGHNTPSVNVINDRALLDFARGQIRLAEKFAVAAN
jgi:hypothetical protein